MSQNIFSYNSDVDKNAYLNWRTEKHNLILNMITVAKGFMDSALINAEAIIEDNNDKKADILIFPILFNVNHAIELYLKAITWELNILLNNNKEIEGQHDIKQIFSVVKSRVNEYETEKLRRRQFNDFVNDLDEYIHELFSHIDSGKIGNKKDNMDFSRYPFNQKYVNHFYIDKIDNVVIDVENLIERFEGIGNSLHRIAIHYLYDHIEKE